MQRTTAVLSRILCNKPLITRGVSHGSLFRRIPLSFNRNYATTKSTFSQEDLSTEKDQKLESEEEVNFTYTTDSTAASQIVALETEDAGRKEYALQNEFIRSANVAEAPQTVRVLKFSYTPHRDFDKLFNSWIQQFPFHRTNEFINRKFFASSVAETAAQFLRRVYVPYYVISCRTQTKYSGEVGYDVWALLWKFRFKKTQWSKEQGERTGVHYDRFVPATDAIDRQLLQKIQHWDLSKTVSEWKWLKDRQLKGADLAAYSSISPREAWLKEVGKKEISQCTFLLKQQFNAQHVRNVNVDIQRMNVFYCEAVALPVYIGHYRYFGMNFCILVNGQTGSFSGMMPVTLTRWLQRFRQFFGYFLIFCAFYAFFWSVDNVIMPYVKQLKDKWTNK